METAALPPELLRNGLIGNRTRIDTRLIGVLGVPGASAPCIGAPGSRTRQRSSPALLIELADRPGIEPGDARFGVPHAPSAQPMNARRWDRTTISGSSIQCLDHVGHTSKSCAVFPRRTGLPRVSILRGADSTPFQPGRRVTPTGLEAVSTVPRCPASTRAGQRSFRQLRRRQRSLLHRHGRTGHGRVQLLSRRARPARPVPEVGVEPTNSQRSRRCGFTGGLPTRAWIGVSARGRETGDQPLPGNRTLRTKLEGVVPQSIRNKL